jgi:uncharacterized protein (PEP-CTERM system associated)
MTRTHRSRAAGPAAWTAGLLALSSSLIGDVARAADPEGEAAPPRVLVLEPSLGLQETYTDNVALTAANRISDLITRALASLEARLDTGRSKVRLDVQVAYDAYSRESDRSGWTAAADGAASYALAPDLLTLRANGAISNGTISSFARSATDRHGAPGRIQLATYDVGPELTGRIADRLDVTAAARFGQVLYSNASGGPLAVPRDDSIAQVVGAVQSDASRRLQLQTSGEYLHDDLDFTSATGVQSAYLRVARGWRLIGRLGYDHIRQGPTLRIDAPLASAGFEYQPSSSSRITIEAGRRYHRPVWSADAVVELSPRVLAAAAYSEQVQPDQVGIARSFRAFAEAAQKLPPPLVPANFNLPPDLANATSLYRSASLRAVYDDLVNNLAVTAEWTSRKFLTVAGQDRSLLMNAVFTRRVRPDLTLALRASYARTFESPSFGPSRALGASAELAYRVNSRTDVAVNVSHTDNRQLASGGERVRENAIFAALRRRF